MRRRWTVVVLSLLCPPAGAAGPTPDDAAVLAALCPRGHRCQVERRDPAGRDAQGLDLVVATVKVLDKVVGERDPARPAGPCLLEPVGVLRLRGGVVVSAEPIMILNRDSGCEYGANGGDEEVAAAEGRATFDMAGGTSWQWRDSKEWALSPRVVLLSSEHQEWNNQGVLRWLARTDEVHQRTEVIARAPVCGREPDEAGGGGAVEGDPSAYRYLVIPRTWRSAAATGHGWREDHDELRWLSLDSSGASGYLVHGKAGPSGDARLRVTALDPRLLLVDVADDHFVPAAEPWTHADHLELWGTPDRPGPFDRCLERRRPPPDDASSEPVGPAWQWRLMLDGTVHPAAGHPPDSPLVEVAEVDTRSWGKVRRFRIDVPSVVNGITVVYSDSDDGVTQKRLIGTSRLRFGDAASLGKVEADERRRR